MSIEISHVRNTCVQPSLRKTKENTINASRCRHQKTTVLYYHRDNPSRQLLHSYRMLTHTLFPIEIETSVPHKLLFYVLNQDLNISMPLYEQILYNERIRLIGTTQWKNTACSIYLYNKSISINIPHTLSVSFELFHTVQTIPSIPTLLKRALQKKTKIAFKQKIWWASLNRPILTCGRDPPARIEPTDSGTVVYMTQHAKTTELRCLYAVDKI